MKDRDGHPFAQLALNFEAFRSFHIFQIDAAKGWLQRRYDSDQTINVIFRNLDVEYIDAREFLEQNRLAFHHGLGSERTYVAKPQYRRAIRYHRNEILPHGERRSLAGIGGDRKARRGNARRIGKREIMLRPKRLGRHDLKLAGAWHAMVEQRARRDIGTDGVGHEPGSFWIMG